MQGGKSHKSLAEEGSQQIKILSREIMKTLLLLTAMCCVCLALPSQKLQQRKREITGKQACGGLLTDPQGFIRSPNFPMKYPNNTRCVWKISIGSPVKISFINFNLEGSMFSCSFDKLQIYDGDREVELCGMMLPLDFTSTQNTVTIVFTTDDTVAKTGFRLTYAPATNSVSTNSNGQTTTKTPAPTTTRTAAIRKMLSQRQQLSLVLQPLPTTARTTPTTTKVSTRTTTTKPTTTTTRTTTRSTTTTTMSTPLLIRYTDCGGLLTDLQGFIHSPNFPSQYPNNAHCVWKISNGSPVKISFINFDIEGSMFSCYFDQLQIYDGENELELCGMMLPLDFTSTESIVTIIFNTDDTVSKTGFRLTYQAVE